MKLFVKRKDGGAESSVTGYWLIELKSLFSICLLRFDGHSREAYHTHAFNCLTWVLTGRLFEQFFSGRMVAHDASWRPFVTRRTDFHKVDSIGVTWVLSFRGPWAASWREYLPKTREFLTLATGRLITSRTPALIGYP